MQNSLEVRVPILDHKVAELTFRIPSGLKLKGNEKKYIFKKAMSKYLPPKILNHKKQGFTVPLNVWFKKDLNEYVNDRLISGNNRLNGYINKEYLIKLANGNSNGSRNFSGKIWPLLFLDAWLEKNNGVSGS
jgi:asparagine synthase (glutamine-hydrolysing)